MITIADCTSSLLFVLSDAVLVLVCANVSCYLCLVVHRMNWCWSCIQVYTGIYCCAVLHVLQFDWCCHAWLILAVKIWLGKLLLSLAAGFWACTYWLKQYIVMGMVSCGFIPCQLICKLSTPITGMLTIGWSHPMWTWESTGFIIILVWISLINIVPKP